MEGNINSLAHLLLVIVLSAIASVCYFFIFKTTNKQITFIDYLILFFVCNTVSLLSGLLRLFDLDWLSIIINSTCYVTAAFALRQIILLRNNLPVIPLYKNRYLYLSLFSVVLFCNFYLFYYLQDTLFIRVLLILLFLIIVVVSAIYTGFKNKFRQLTVADRFLIFMVLMTVFMDWTLFLTLYTSNHFMFFRDVFPSLQIIKTSLWTMTFVIVLMLDIINIRYEQSIRDSLTGLYNREFFGKYVAKSQVDFIGLHGLMFVDIDFFKKVNDQHGHSAGDLVIKSVGDSINNYIETNGVVARFGGEEFAVLYKDVDEKQLYKLAEKLRNEIEQLIVTYEEKTIKVTVSVGAVPLSGETPLQEALKQADKALYEAKQTGRNKVCVI